ncbi:stalk domain-containing protein [Paenibacillus sacheonensis]|uniref:Copper amine oxidase-like N-terminal domain-containing protein n=1 Tax=Paenibacillus sacheonensis TaxID=742054 RepID=A0A7X4YR64_9BACL|nr:stalk domain-containing protein [Paenibacillus sacheonensis]MBM7565116.1 hypothetical protein [Paenibacillus sacheonensis]NBC70101.1 hypothetical protein [Paenibacillus sacheonensis]
MKRWIGLALTLMAVFAAFAGTASAANASTDIKVKLNGEWVIFPAPPVLQNGKTFVEFRTLFTKLGYSIDYNAATKTIKAKSAARSIQMTPTGTSALVDGVKVPVNGEMKLLKGRTMVGVRFIATLSDKDVAWDGAKKIVAITDKGPTAAQEAEVFAVLNKLTAAEDKQDADAFLALFHSASPIKDEMDAYIRSEFAKTHSRTVYTDMTLDSYSATEAIVYTVEQSTKVSGASFYPNVENEMEYTLHKDTNGQWAIYDVYVDYSTVLDEDGLWAQEVQTSDADRAALTGMVDAYVKSVNAKDIAAYKAILDPSDEEAYGDDTASMEESFTDPDYTISVALVRSAVVELDEDTAIVLASFRYDLTSADEEPLSFKSVTQFDLVKKDGKWLVTPGSSDNELIGEQIEQ